MLVRMTMKDWCLCEMAYRLFLLRAEACYAIVLMID